MNWRLIALAGLLSVPACAEWQRYAVIEGHEFFEAADPHQLTYFMRDALLRPERGFCYRCTPEQKAKEARQNQPKASVQVVGLLNGFAIYDLFFTFDEHGGYLPPKWKSILVKTGPNEYREIYHYQPAQSDARADP